MHAVPWRLLPIISAGYHFLNLFQTKYHSSADQITVKILQGTLTLIRKIYLKNHRATERKSLRQIGKSTNVYARIKTETMCFAFE